MKESVERLFGVSRGKSTGERVCETEHFSGRAVPQGGRASDSRSKGTEDRDTETSQPL